MDGDLTFDLDDIRSIMKSLASHFGDTCEIVLHDFIGGFDSSVIAIENGHVTGRGEGSSITTSGLEALSGDPAQIGDGIYNYFSTTPDGKTIRSSTAILHGPDGSIRGSVCINQDITRYRIMEDTLRTITRSDLAHEGQEVFFQNVDQLLDYYIAECSRTIGRLPSAMNKDELSQAIHFLEEKGVFRIKKAGENVCSVFGITKYQLYRQLDFIRGTNAARDERDLPAASSEG